MVPVGRKKEIIKKMVSTNQCEEEEEGKRWCLPAGRPLCGSKLRRLKMSK